MVVEEGKILLLRLRAGEMEALRELFDRYYLPLCCYSVQFVDDEKEAQDIVQNIFVSLWEKRHFDKIERLKEYLYVSVRNSSIAAVRTRKEFAALDELDLDNAYSWDDPEALGKELESEYDELKRALKELSPREYEVLMEVVVNSRRYRDVADSMGVSVNTIKTNLQRAMRKLRRLDMLILLCRMPL